MKHHLLQSSLVKVIKCDLENIDLFVEQFPNQIDVMYHLAWEGIQSNERNNYSLQVKNIAYAIKCMDLAKKLQISKVIICGSSLEFQTNDIINENTPLSPQNAYGGCKCAVRKLCSQYANEHKIKLVYCLLASVYGVGRKDGNILDYTITSLLNKEKPIYTSLSQKWDFIHIKDVAIGLYLVGEKGKGSFYTLGNGANLVLKDVILYLRDHINQDLELGIGEKEVFSQTFSTCISMKDFQQEFDFYPRYDLKEGLKELIQFYKEEKKYHE